MPRDRAKWYPPGRAPDPDGVHGALTRERFFARVSPEPNTGCWLWLGAAGNGYGTMGVNQREFKATHVSIVIATGALPAGNALHKCDTPLCVNPDHLFVGSQRDNMRDASRKGRASGPRKLTLSQVEEIRDRLARGERPVDIAPAYGVTAGAVEHIQRGTTWRNKGRAALRVQREAADVPASFALASPQMVMGAVR